jgi:hypothetical protein
LPLGHLLDAGLEILPTQNQIGPYEYVVRVRTLSARRGPAFRPLYLTRKLTYRAN